MMKNDDQFSSVIQHAKARHATDREGRTIESHPLRIDVVQANVGIGGWLVDKQGNRRPAEVAPLQGWSKNFRIPNITRKGTDHDHTRREDALAALGSGVALNDADRPDGPRGDA